MTDGDYITINPAVSHGKYNVVVMRDSGRGEYSVFRISDPLKKIAAESLAQSWAAAMKLEIRRGYQEDSGDSPAQS